MPIRFQVDPDFYDHPKTIDASDAAVALWTRAGSYSTAKLLDGFVPENALALLSKVPDEAAAELVGRRLWRRVKGGYRFHQWEARNLTRARVEADKESDRERKRREREAARQNAKPQVNGHVVHPDSVPDSAGIPPGVHPLSVSVSLSGSVSGSGRETRPPAKCPEHVNIRNPPDCGRCADARREADAWDAESNERIRLAAKCPLHPWELAHNCRVCASEELSPA
jgi:hypothetical protein